MMDTTYILSRREGSGFRHQVNIGNCYFQTNQSCYSDDKQDGREIILFGEYLDFRQPSQSLENLVRNLAKQETFDKLLSELQYLVGRYLVISYTSDEGIRLIGDATGTIPIYYSIVKNQPMAASSASELGKRLNLPISNIAQKVREQAMEQQQPMPYDMTMYDKVKVVIPNHYLDWDKQGSIRYFPSQDLPKRQLSEVVDETITIVNRVIDQMEEQYDLALALTSGLDSRLVLSFFKNRENVALYTYIHESFTDETPDVYVPQMVSEKYDMPYYKLPRKHLPAEELKKIEAILPGQVNQRILENAYTFKHSELKNRAFITGDIIPLAKSNFGQNLPEKLATPQYFVTKSHNYSVESKQAIKSWVRDAKATSQNNLSLFDLFFWENRWGRWFTNNAVNYDYYTHPLYIFNSRYLIELWLSIPRSVRVKKAIHKQIIDKNWPELLDIPINPNEGRLSQLSDNQWVYYFGSFAKHYINKYRK
ncbi:hypothetical protein [Aerococcus suis]|nr:hypothetical protein [Aerococcus suis]